MLVKGVGAIGKTPENGVDEGGLTRSVPKSVTAGHAWILGPAPAILNDAGQDQVDSLVRRIICA